VQFDIEPIFMLPFKCCYIKVELISKKYQFQIVKIHFEIKRHFVTIDDSIDLILVTRKLNLVT
ncbi:hypothetical protein QAC70_13160, partial [Staphylococcus aureus]